MFASGAECSFFMRGQTQAWKLYVVGWTRRYRRIDIRGRCDQIEQIQSSSTSLLHLLLFQQRRSKKWRINVKKTHIRKFVGYDRVRQSCQRAENVQPDPTKTRSLSPQPESES